MSKKFTMPAGDYYIGDLCYVFSRDTWEKCCNLFGDGKLNDVYELSNGVKFAIFSTMYGDGFYPSSVGKNFPVDSGTIGCVKLSEIDNLDHNQGWIKTFENDFIVYEYEGTIFIGNVAVYTNNDDIDSDDYYDYYDELETS